VSAPAGAETPQSGAATLGRRAGAARADSSAGSAGAGAARRPTGRPGRWYTSGFFWTLFSVLTAAYGYVGERFIGPSELVGAPRVLAWLVVVVLVAMVPAAFALRWGRWGRGLSRAFQRVHYAVLGVCFLLLLLVMARDAVWLVAMGLDALGLPGGLLPATGLARRALLRETNLALAGLTVGLSLWGYRQATKTPRVKRVDVAIEGLAADLEGLCVVQISDIHLGPNIGRPFLERVVRVVGEQRADLIAITGDLVDGTVSELGAAVAPLGALSAPLGVYFITGNHEYYSGVDAWLDFLPELGVVVLKNDHRKVRRGEATVVIAGVTDPQGRHFGADHRSDPRGAIAGAPRGDLRILLAHQPKSAIEAVDLGFHLQLSGHTHGGQFAAWAPMVKLSQPFVSGLHRLGGMWVYTSRGTGFWGPPMRLGAPSEITRLTLRRA
jgi:predicted MPP superfamily phosphohydrolase